MAVRSFLYKREYEINDAVKIYIPTVGEILDCEDEYYNLVSILTATPIDMMVQLSDIGIDFTAIDDYELFLLTSSLLKSKDTSLIFKDLDLSGFNVAANEEDGTLLLRDEENDITIDRNVHNQIAEVLRFIHHFEKNIHKPANEEAKAFMLERARIKLRRQAKRVQASQLEPLIVAMVNTEQYAYDFEGTRELSIYQFCESVRQVVKKVDYDNRMYGVYAGTINAKELSQDDINWLVHK